MFIHNRLPFNKLKSYFSQIFGNFVKIIKIKNVTSQTRKLKNEIQKPNMKII